MNGNKSVTGNFSSLQFTLSTAVEPAGAGFIVKNPDKTTYNYGEQVTLTANANSGYSFDHWGGDAAGTESTITITIDADKNVTAFFNEMLYTLNITVDPVEGGVVTKTPDKPSYSYGEVVRIKASADSRYRFTEWRGDASGTQKNITITMDSDKYVTAYFKMKFRISGNVIYRETDIPLSNTLIDLSGDTTGSDIADESGFYEFISLDTAETYYTQATRNAGFNECCILSYDAAIAARIAVNLIPEASLEERLSADADCNNDVQMFDAALIAMYAVGIENPQSQIGNWGFSPADRIYSSLDSNYINQNFNGIIVGDVDGNWVPDSPLYKSNSVKKEYAYLTDIETAIGDQISIPLIAEGDQEIISFDAGLNYDPEVLRFVEIRKTELSESFQINMNDSRDGTVRIGGFTLGSITDAGKYLEIVFEVIGNNESTSQVELYSYRINAEEEQQGIATVVIPSGNLTEVPEEYLLYNNYPNPFNPNTTIEYQIPEQGRITLKIYNMLGQEIRTLIDGEKSAGSYAINWDGMDNSGQPVVSGFYFYRLQSNDFVASKKMALMK